jgi:hypothetical protein
LEINFVAKPSNTENLYAKPEVTISKREEKQNCQKRPILQTIVGLQTTQSSYRHWMKAIPNGSKRGSEPSKRKSNNAETHLVAISTAFQILQRNFPHLTKRILTNCNIFCGLFFKDKLASNYSEWL